MMSASVPDRRSLSLVSGPVGAYPFCLDCRTWIGKKRISFVFQVQGELCSEKPGSLQRVRVQVVSLPVPRVRTKLVGRNGQMRGVYRTVELDGGLAMATPMFTDFRIPFGAASIAKEVADQKRSDEAIPSLSGREPFSVVKSLPFNTEFPFASLRPIRASRTVVPCSR